jgi:HlyD family secretion protein
VPNAALRFRPPADPAQPDKAGSPPSSGGPSGPAARAGGAPGTAGAPGGGGRRDAGPRVYKVVDGKLAAVPVQIGISDSTFTEVTGGDIAIGDKLVTRDLSGQGGPQSQVRLRMF